MIKDTSTFYREQPAKLPQKMVGDKAEKELVIRGGSWGSFLKKSCHMKIPSPVSKNKGAKSRYNQGTYRWSVSHASFNQAIKIIRKYGKDWLMAKTDIELTFSLLLQQYI